MLNSDFTLFVATAQLSDTKDTWSYFFTASRDEMIAEAKRLNKAHNITVTCHSLDKPVSETEFAEMLEGKNSDALNYDNIITAFLAQEV
ncbi:hypothetical protein [Alterisphingorhabdus coralli]|uniref:Uncharacterized protein n=1 Tax=Alterisphingorhabdus coralli TaxID=3071408 RepID=A0AA97FAV0_9SPHN|nr:hypothetical protein [Parasphingorhabdus sp. SCSIO 66989]WOE76761.1 hypothetical protein RB602_15355 [Parasphingorhabdus sp. SCSIO 66989]